MNRVQVAVVGAGPAGLSAAISVARAGAHVALFDENATVGGQLRYRVLDGDSPVESVRRELITEATILGVEIYLNAKVWGLFPGRILGVALPGRSEQWQADRIVLATGSTDRAFSFTGGSLPGVMTARGLQILLNNYRVLPAERFAVIGTGVEAAEVERDITFAGGQVVVGVNPDRIVGSLVAEGDEGITHLTVDDQRYPVEIVVIAVGRQPDAALSLMIDCEQSYLPALGGIVPRRDSLLQTSVDGIVVAGDAAGVCNLATARAEGVRAGVSAAHTLGLIDDLSWRQAISMSPAEIEQRLTLVRSADSMTIRV